MRLNLGALQQLPKEQQEDAERELAAYTVNLKQLLTAQGYGEQPLSEEVQLLVEIRDLLGAIAARLGYENIYQGHAKPAKGAKP